MNKRLKTQMETIVIVSVLREKSNVYLSVIKKLYVNWFYSSAAKIQLFLKQRLNSVFSNIFLQQCYDVQIISSFLLVIWICCRMILNQLGTNKTERLCC